MNNFFVYITKDLGLKEDEGTMSLLLYSVDLLIDVLLGTSDLFELNLMHIWGKVFKYGPSKICGRQPLKTFKIEPLRFQEFSQQRG